MLTKVCNACHEDLPTERFAKRNDTKHAPSGLQPRCMRCTNRDAGAKWRKEQRINILNAYGHTCACCGESNEAFLQIDHVNDDGAQHRAQYTSASQLYASIKRAGYPLEYQILCANCNMAKGRAGGCPHKIVVSA